MFTLTALVQMKRISQCYAVLRARLALLCGPALLLSVVPVKVVRGSLYHRLSAVSDAIE